MQTVHLVAGARTPFAEWIGGRTGRGAPGGALARHSALDLGKRAARAALERSGLEGAAVDEVIFGNALQTSGDALYGARHVGLGAGVPVDRPALTVNRLCGSGIEAVAQAAARIRAGESGVVLAGGMESLSQAPMVLRGARGGYRLGHRAVEDSLLAALRDTWCGLLMAETAEALASERGLGRAEQDAFALRSLSAGRAARDAGLLAGEIAAVDGVDQDDHLFEAATAEGLAALRPAFSGEGTVTAGNASGLVDGAAALVVAGERAVSRHDLPTLARVVDAVAVGVEPARMGLGPVPAIRRLLQRNRLGLDEVDRFEINEAFAAQYLAVEKDLGLDRERVNVWGGAIAWGHPLGATGTRLLLTLARQLEHFGLRRGVAAACIGGGQGIALLLERD